jgi:hypothetical protein
MTANVERALPWLLLMAAGCMTVARGQLAQPLDEQGKPRQAGDAAVSGLRLSSRIVSELTSEHLGFIEITFENQSDRWIWIDRANIRANDASANQNVVIPLGEELVSWQRAAVERAQIRNLDNAPVLALISDKGAAMHVLPKESSVDAAASGVTSIALSALLKDSQARPTFRADVAKTVPATHLLSLPFSIPPGLFARRWIVLDTSRDAAIPCLRRMLLEYQVRDGARERSWLRLRGYVRNSGIEWQSKRCDD